MTAGVVPNLLPSASSGNEGNLMEAKRGRIDVNLVERAVQALLQHLKKEAKKESLFDDEERIVLQFSLVKIPTPSGRTSGKPTVIRIPHSIWKSKGKNNEDVNDGDEPERVEDADICIIVKDKVTKANIKQIIPLFPTHLGNVKKIIPLESLRKKYSQFQQRRELLHQYTIFLADDRILPMVGSLLGKSFFQSKKQPIPVCVTRKGSFPFAVRNSITNTHLFLPSGTCIGLRVGHSEMSPSHLVENCVAAACNVAERITGKWSNIQSISIKSTNSVALPFYTVTPKELLQLFPRRVDNKQNNKNVDKEEKNKEEDEEDIVESASKHNMKKKLKNSPTPNTTTMDDDNNDDKKKIKAPAKSPLLVALKKQKEQEAQLQALTGHTSESHNDNKLTISDVCNNANADEGKKKIKGIKRKESVANTTATTTTTTSPCDAVAVAVAVADSTMNSNKKKKKIDNIPLIMNDGEDIKKGRKKTKDYDEKGKADGKALKNKKMK